MALVGINFTCCYNNVDIMLRCELLSLLSFNFKTSSPPQVFATFYQLRVRDFPLLTYVRAVIERVSVAVAS